jgi:hypothetical protein
MAPIPPLPPNHLLVRGLDQFATTLEIYDALCEWSASAGFAICKIRSVRLDEAKIPGRIDIGCDRGKITPSQAHLRETTTKKMGCQRNAKIGSKRGVFYLQINDDHNHEQSDNPKQHIQHRQLSPQQAAYVESLCLLPSKPREILNLLEKQYPGVHSPTASTMTLSLSSPILVT